jgi:hypothetical protein
LREKITEKCINAFKQRNKSYLNWINVAFPNDLKQNIDVARTLGYVQNIKRSRTLIFYTLNYKVFIKRPKNILNFNNVLVSLKFVLLSLTLM